MEKDNKTRDKDEKAEKLQPISQNADVTPAKTPDAASEKANQPCWLYMLKSWLNTSLSLFFYSLTILVILAVFLLLLFYLPSKRTYINMNIKSDQLNIENNIVEECSFYSEGTELTDFDEIIISSIPTATTQSIMDIEEQSDGSITISGDHLKMKPITLIYDYAVIDEEEFKEPLELVIKPLQNNHSPNMPNIIISHKNGYESISLHIAKSHSDGIKNASCDSINISQSDITLNRLVDKIALHGGSRTKNINSSLNTIHMGTELDVTISSCSIQLFCKGELMKDYSSEGQVRILFPNFRNIDLIVNNANCSFSGITNFKSKISHIHHLDHFGDGDISVAYTPEFKEHTILKQPVSIHSKDGSFFTATIIQEELQDELDDENHSLFSLSAYGFADEVRLANISLLPDMFSWFRENVYVLPTSIITIILGSIQLVSREKKEKSESKQTPNKQEKETA